MDYDLEDRNFTVFAFLSVEVVAEKTLLVVRVTSFAVSTLTRDANFVHDEEATCTFGTNSEETTIVIGLACDTIF